MSWGLCCIVDVIGKLNDYNGLHLTILYPSHHYVYIVTVLNSANAKNTNHFPSPFPSPPLIPSQFQLLISIIPGYKLPFPIIRRIIFYIRTTILLTRTQYPPHIGRTRFRHLLQIRIRFIITHSYCSILTL